MARHQNSVVGLDLGQVGDFSALVHVVSDGAPRATYTLPTMHRWRLGTSYTDVSKDVVAFLRANPQAELAIDETGVGTAVSEILLRELEEARLDQTLVLVTITGGNAVTRQSMTRWHVSKRQLVSVTSAVVHSGRLLVPKGQPEAQQLLREMQNFKAKINLATGNESFEAWRERDHDDLVLALAIGLWAAERPQAEAGAF